MNRKLDRLLKPGMGVYFCAILCYTTVDVFRVGLFREQTTCVLRIRIGERNKLQALFRSEGDSGP